MRKITNNLYIGNREDTLTLLTKNESFDIIIYLGQEIPTKLCFNCKPTCIHIPLNDGKNGLSKIRNTLFLVYIASLNKKILIACRAGISRSVSVTTAVYALTQKISFDEAYKQIKAIVPESQPELNLLKEVRQITEELKCCI